MIRKLIGLAIALLLAHFAWKVAPVWLHYFEYKVEVEELARFGGELTDTEMQAKVVKAAQSFQIPITDRHVQVRRVSDRIYIDVVYQQELEVLPRYMYPWDFSIHINVLTTKIAPGS